LQGNQTTVSFRSKRRDGSDDYEEQTGEQLRRTIFVEYQTRYDNGHDFSTVRNEFTFPATAVKVFAPQRPGQEWWPDLTYVGPLRPTGVIYPLWPDNYALSSDALNALGNKWIGLVAPTNSEAALAQFFAELKTDGLPKLYEAIEFLRRPSIRNAGGAYLSEQFDWVPFKNDIQQAAKAVLQATAKLKQFARDSGKSVRRKRHIGSVSGTKFIGNDGSEPGFAAANHANVTSSMLSDWGLTTTVDKYTVDSWFSGAFTYHLAAAGSLLQNADKYEQLANHLLGTDFNINTLWQITPWSWLTDWFVDVGGFLRNVNLFHSSDNLVLRYGYVMSHCVAERQRTMAGLKPVSGGSVSLAVVTSTARTEWKIRQRATPYGFGLLTDSFSSHQWAILGALGMTKAPQTLH